jgi:hypothetical protein
VRLRIRVDQATLYPHLEPLNLRCRRPMPSAASKVPGSALVPSAGFSVPLKRTLTSTAAAMRDGLRGDIGKSPRRRDAFASTRDECAPGRSAFAPSLRLHFYLNCSSLSKTRPNATPAPFRTSCQPMHRPEFDARNRCAVFDAPFYVLSFKYSGPCASGSDKASALKTKPFKTSPKKTSAARPANRWAAEKCFLS